MKIVLIVTVPQSLIFFQGQIQHFKNVGFKVEIISSPGFALDKFCDENDVIGHSIEMKRKISLYHDIIALWRLIHLLRNINPTLVHSGTPKAGLLGMIASAIIGVRTRVYTIHGLRFETLTGTKRHLVKLFESLSALISTNVLAVSPSLKKKAIENRICSKEKITVLLNGSCNGVDTQSKFNPQNLNTEKVRYWRSQFNICSTDFIIGFVGRLVKDKGIDDLVSSWMELKVQYKNIKLLVIGDFEENDNLKRETVQTILNDKNIILVKNTSEIEVFYCIMDLFVLPTYREGFGNVLIEAAAMCVPVITTNATGARDAIVHDTTGFQIPVGDVDQLTRSIKVYINDSVLREMHGLAGRKWVTETFDCRKIHEALVSYYRSFMN